MGYVPGYVFVTHAKGAGSTMISLGEHLSALWHPSKLVHKPRPWYYTHAGVIVGDDGTTVEAQAAGVVHGNIAAYAAHALLRPPPGVDLAKVAAAAEAMVGWSYGWGDLIDMGVDTLLHTRLADTDKHQTICSQLAALALVAGGWTIPDGRRPARVMPSTLDRWLGHT
jgi:hypothetical protein